jgi:hypothetical protein
MRRPSPLNFEHHGDDDLDDATYAAVQNQKLRVMTSPSHTVAGGVRVGSRVIGFGDFPELVEVELARERVERQRAEQDMRGRKGMVNGRKGAVARAVSDVREGEREREIVREREPHGDRLDSGRRRTLSSPERAVGLGLWGPGMSIRN